jgi:hypothetical protein
MSAPIAPAHSPFGGSVAARVLRCPASVSLVQKVPERLRKVSAYATRGTALHSALALALDTDMVPIESFVGKTFSGYMVTHDDIENALRPVYDYVTGLLDTPGAEFYLEHRVAFPTIAGAYGTVDLLVGINRTIFVIDFKFGVGVLVRALYPADDDPDTDIINSQLLFYAAAARHSLPDFFADVERIVLAIVQPISTDLDAEMVSTVTVTPVELDAFITVYRAACEQALAPAPRLERGDHCRFCPARPICPAHTAPLLDLAQLAMPIAAPPAKSAYLQLLADGLNLVDAVKDLRVALHDQAKRALESGDIVPGYSLSAGRAERYWRNESEAMAALQKLGFARDDLMLKMMRSPKQVEIRAKARGLKVPLELIESHRSGVSLVRSENARVPMLGRSENVRLFSEALEAFRGGRQV